MLHAGKLQLVAYLAQDNIEKNGLMIIIACKTINYIKKSCNKGYFNVGVPDCQICNVNLCAACINTASNCI